MKLPGLGTKLSMNTTPQALNLIGPVMRGLPIESYSESFLKCAKKSHWGIHTFLLYSYNVQGGRY